MIARRGDSEVETCSRTISQGKATVKTEWLMGAMVCIVCTRPEDWSGSFSCLR